MDNLMPFRLSQLNNIDFTTYNLVIPGHGDVGDSSMVDTCIEYLETMIPIITPGMTTAVYKQLLFKSFPIIKFKICWTCPAFSCTTLKVFSLHCHSFPFAMTAPSTEFKIPISTPLGVLNAWAITYGNPIHPRILLVQGGPGTTHDYLISTAQSLAGQGYSVTMYGPIGTDYSEKAANYDFCDLD